MTIFNIAKSYDLNKDVGGIWELFGIEQNIFSRIRFVLCPPLDFEILVHTGDIHHTERNILYSDKNIEIV